MQGKQEVPVSNPVLENGNGLKIKKNKKHKAIGVRMKKREKVSF